MNISINVLIFELEASQIFALAVCENGKSFAVRQFLKNTIIESENAFTYEDEFESAFSGK
jgi:hypothetical protein